METRKSSQHSVFGNANELLQTMLPTNMEIAQYFLKLKTRENVDEYSVVEEAVAKLWKKALTLTVLQKSIVKRVTVLIETWSKLYHSKSSSSCYATFTSSFNSLFDISACKCSSLNESIKGLSISCNCRDLKVLREE